MPERLIDRAKLLEYLAAIKPDEYVSAYGEAAVDVINHVETYVNEMPTIEAEPVRHGRWIEKPPYADETVKGLEFQIVCSRCDEQNSSITFDENSVPIAKTFYRTRYCPNCGARMDGGADNG